MSSPPAPPPPSNASPPPATAASRSPPPPTPTPPARPTPPASSPPLSSSPSPPQSNPPPSTSPPSFTTPILSPPSGSTPRPPSGRNSPPIASGRNPPPEVTGTARSPPSTSSSSSSNDNSNGLSTGSIVGIAIGGVSLLVLLVILSILFIRCKSRKGAHSDPPLLPPGPKALCYSQRVYNWLRGVLSSGHHVSNVPPEPSRPPTGTSTTLGFILRKFTYEELSSATDGFSESNHLGHGGFGYVHRGVLLQDGIEIEVAVKQLKAGSGQGDREFQAEVDIISRLHHKNLVSLVGYCNAQTQRLIVYDFVPNKTLEFHLHGKGSTPTLVWSKRLKISQGTARGLAYLHENCHRTIIHRDIKATNILLDEHFEAKVADFGLARIISAVNTCASRVMGTPGYSAPEYTSTGILTVKSDVFSFGVVLLELITGRRPQSFTGIGFVEWARPLLTQALKDKKFDALVDPRLQKDYDPNEMARMAACAAACVYHSEWQRPRMSQVVMALEGNIASLSDLNEGMRPGPSSVYSSDNDTVQYNENMKNMLKMAFSSQEFGSTSQYSNTTSEYGLYPSGSSSDVQQTREIEMKRMKDFCGGKLDGEQLK